MTWNYRIVKDEFDNGYFVHEVYYDKDGKIESWSENAIRPHGETKEELFADLSKFIIAFSKPVLEFDIDGLLREVE